MVGDPLGPSSFGTLLHNCGTQGGTVRSGQEEDVVDPGGGGNPAGQKAEGPPSPQVGPTDHICLPGQGHNRSSQYATLLGRSVLGRFGHRMCLPNHGGRGCRGTKRLVHTLPRSVSSHTASAQYAATRKTRPNTGRKPVGTEDGVEPLGSAVGPNCQQSKLTLTARVVHRSPKRGDRVQPGCRGSPVSHPMMVLGSCNSPRLGDLLPRCPRYRRSQIG